MKINYLYRKGRIVTITWKHGGEICKVLARPGQTVKDTIKNAMYTLEEGEYIVENLLWIKSSDYLAPQLASVPKAGFKVHEQHLVASTEYEKRLRRRGIHISPDYEPEPPEIIIGETLITRRVIRGVIMNTKPPKRTIIKDIYKNGLVVLSNDTTTNKTFLVVLFRKPKSYENKIRFLYPKKVSMSTT